MTELEELKAHRDLLVNKLDDILEQFVEFREIAANDKREYGLRAKRFKIALTSIVVMLLIVSWAGITSYRTAKNLEAFVTCQSQFNDIANRASAIRSRANQAWTTATLAYGLVRNDPRSTDQQVNEARKHYFDTLQQLAETQQKNQLPVASTCKLDN